MKKILQSIALLLLLCMTLSALLACDLPGEDQPDEQPQTQGEQIDYAASVKLDLASSETVKQEVTVVYYIDGDTTHFRVPTSIEPSGLLKARYLAVNTPESTGTVEEWGKTAAEFTHKKLESATSIYVESDSAEWEYDSNGRMLVWVWYRPAGSSEYRNLNIELLQNGLAIASNSANNRYGTTAMAAIAQARANSLYIYSGKKDDNFYYGKSILTSIKDLRTNPEYYLRKDVVFEGVIVREGDNTLYVVSYDEEDDLYYGMTVYYGYTPKAGILNIFDIGNRIRFIGNFQYFESGHTYQIADPKYDITEEGESSVLIEKGVEVVYSEISAKLFAEGKKTVSVKEFDEDGTPVQRDKTFDYAELILNTTVSLSDLTVTRVSTTTTEGSSSKGAMTLTCSAPDGSVVVVRTVVLRDAAGNTITADAYEGKTINVRGLVDFYYNNYNNGQYQIKVFSYKDIEVKA